MVDLTMDDLLTQVGDCGRYQLLIIPLSMACIPMSVWGMLTMVFGALEPDWWCESRGLGERRAPASQSDEPFQISPLNRISHENVTLANQPASSYEVTSIWSVDETSDMAHNGFLLNDSSRLKFCGNESEFKCEKIIFASTENTLVSEFKLVCDLDWVPTLIISLQMVGVLVGSVVAGQMADSVGRKKTLVFMTVLQTVFPLVAGFSTSWQMFAVMRTLIGITVGGIQTIGFPYQIEFVGVRWRAAVASVPIWGFGVCTFSLVVWVLRDWRHIHFATAAVSGATLFAWIILPESVRWLSVKGHVDKAHHVIRKMAKWNHHAVPDETTLKDVFTHSEETTKTKYTFWHLFVGWKMAKLSAIVGFMWFMCSLCYYGVAFSIKDLSGDFYLNFFLMALMDVPAVIMVHFTLTRFGRRKVLVAGFLIVAVASLAVVPVYFFAPADYAGKLTNGLAMTGRLILNFSWSAMGVFHAEVYPTVIRNIGTGYANTMARISGIAVPYVLVGAGSEPYKLYAVAGSLMLLVALCPFLLPETGGRPLEDELKATARKSDVVTTVV